MLYGVVIAITKITKFTYRSTAELPSNSTYGQTKPESLEQLQPH